MCIANRFDQTFLKFEKCLKDSEHDPEECTTEQIRECHGDIEVEEHPCEVEVGRGMG